MNCFLSFAIQLNAIQDLGLFLEFVLAQCFYSLLAELPAEIRDAILAPLQDQLVSFRMAQQAAQQQPAPQSEEQKANAPADGQAQPADGNGQPADANAQPADANANG